MQPFSSLLYILNDLTVLLNEKEKKNYIFFFQILQFEIGASYEAQGDKNVSKARKEGGLFLVNR